MAGLGCSPHATSTLATAVPGSREPDPACPHARWSADPRSRPCPPRRWRPAGSLPGPAGIAGGRGQILRDRLGDREEHQVNADAGREEHRGPGEDAELRFGMVRAELRFAHPRQGGDQHEDHHQAHDKEVVPAHIDGNPANHGADDRLRILCREHGPERDGKDSCGRTDKDRFVDPGPRYSGFGCVRFRKFAHWGSILRVALELCALRQPGTLEVPAATLRPAAALRQVSRATAAKRRFPEAFSNLSKALRRPRFL